MKYYTIRVKGHLAPSWSDQLQGLTIQNLPSGISELTGAITDQAALYGLLAQFRDLGLELLAINQVDLREGE